MATESAMRDMYQYDQLDSAGEPRLKQRIVVYDADTIDNALIFRI